MSAPESGQAEPLRIAPSLLRRKGYRMSWRRVAIALAERLGHNEPCSDHTSPDPDNCPFCADADALRLFSEKVLGTEVSA